MSGIQVEIPHSSVEQIAREVCEEMIAQSRPAAIRQRPLDLRAMKTDSVIPRLHRATFPKTE